MSFYYLFFVFSVVLAVDNVDNTSNFRVKRMKGGDAARIDNYPYAVSLEYRGKHECGGNIISAWHVITACHCFANARPSDVRVRAGTSLKEQLGSLHPVAVYECDRRFDGFNIGFDVAIVKVGEKFVFDASRQPIELFGAADVLRIGEEGVIAGWGLAGFDLSQYRPITPNQLLAMRMTIAADSECKVWHNYTARRIIEPFVCAKRNNAEGPCPGDSGSGLVVRGRLAGTFTFGMKWCTGSFLPAVFKAVSVSRAWIDDRVANMGHGKRPIYRSSLRRVKRSRFFMRNVIS